MQNIYIIAFIIILLIIYSCKKSDVQIANKPIVAKSNLQQISVMRTWDGMSV